jgi:hypothetical protein
VLINPGLHSFAAARNNMGSGSNGRATVRAESAGWHCRFNHACTARLQW